MVKVGGVGWFVSLFVSVCVCTHSHAHGDTQPCARERISRTKFVMPGITLYVYGCTVECTGAGCVCVYAGPSIIVPPTSHANSNRVYATLYYKVLWCFACMCACERV